MTEEQIKQKAEVCWNKRWQSKDSDITKFERQKCMPYDNYIDGFIDAINFTTKELQEENERLKKDSEENQDLATIAYMQGASKNKSKLDKAEVYYNYQRTR